MNQPKYMQIGWAVSVALHLLLAVIFLLLVLPVKPFMEEFAELYFQTMPAPPKLQKKTPPITPAAKTKPETREDPKEQVVPRTADRGARVKLPQRRNFREDEMEIPISESTRLQEPPKPDAAEATRKVSMPTAEETGRALPDVPVGEREIPSVDKLLTPGQRPAGPGVSTTPLTGTSRQPFEILWEGPSREILSGPLPEYPPDVSREVRIRLEFQVLPDGSVGMITPITKGETTLENLAIETLRIWRFSPLDLSQPQGNQSAVITFVFTLK